MESLNYYQILEVPVNSTFEGITRSYRRLALALHPDRNTTPGAKEAFQKVSLILLYTFTSS